MAVLETHKLTKTYGKIQAVKDLDLTIQEGMVFGFLGPNGSGKTTTLALLLQVLRPTSGSFSWFGEKQQVNVRKQIGAILESPCFYPYLSGYRNLTIAARIKEVSLQQVDPVLQLVDLHERKDDPFRTYSLGMKQRLAIASALLADPKVLILDEPTNGLDPQGIVEIRNLIRKIAATGKTIILASHLLDEVQKVCSHFMVLRKGQKLYQGSVSEALTNQTVIQIGARDLEKVSHAVEKLPGVTSVEQADGILSIKAPGISTEAVNAFLIERGFVLNHLLEKGGSLEEQFLRILSEHD